MTETYNQMLARVREHAALKETRGAYWAGDMGAVHWAQWKEKAVDLFPDAVKIIEHQARLIELAREALGLYASADLYAGERDEDGYTEAMLNDMSKVEGRTAGLWSGKTARQTLAELSGGKSINQA